MTKLSFLLLVVLLTSFKPPKKPSIYYARVFVADSVVNNLDKDISLIYKDRKDYFDGIYPIIGIRINYKLNNALFINYRFGYEKSMDLDFTYDEKCNCYKSNEKMLFTPTGSRREFVSLYILNNNRIKLTYVETEIIKEYFFTLTYVQKIVLKKYRNSYYSESGFFLFKGKVPHF
jgi:hypothetical protein